MYTHLCKMFGITLPIFAFSRSREVVAEVSKAGGMGVLGALSYSNRELDEHLMWIDDHVDGKPYGVDIVIPQSYEGRDQGPLDKEKLEAMISSTHRKFIEDLLAQYQVDELPANHKPRENLLGWSIEGGNAHVDIALRHSVKLIANALGTPPPETIKHIHHAGVQIAALCGNKEQALAHKKAGVDIIIAQGWEAGGHTGKIAGMILCPEIVDAVGDTPVLMAGGIGTGRQLAAALALGAQGGWLGSIWLATQEHVNIQSQGITELLLEASSSQTIRSRAMTGKPARQLQTQWVRAWEAENAPDYLPMPLQWLAQSHAVERISYHNVKELMMCPIGQIVGRMNEIEPVRTVMAKLGAELDETLSRLKKGSAL